MGSRAQSFSLCFLRWHHPVWALHTINTLIAPKPIPPAKQFPVQTFTLAPLFPDPHTTGCLLRSQFKCNLLLTTPFKWSHTHSFSLTGLTLYYCCQKFIYLLIVHLSYQTVLWGWEIWIYCFIPEPKTVWHIVNTYYTFVECINA